VLASIAECPGCVDGAGKILARYDAYVTCPCYSCGSKLFRRPIDGINQYDNYYPCLKFFNKERTISGCEIRRNQAATRITRTRAGSNEEKITLLHVGAGPCAFRSLRPPIPAWTSANMSSLSAGR
jgi:hypothetical protein